MIISGVLGSLVGLKIMRSDYALDKKQFRFPRTRKKRIMKKWRNDNRNFNNIPGCYQMGNMLIAHPSIIEKFIRDAEIDKPKYKFIV